MEKIKATNVEATAFAPITSSVITDGSSIMPERFTSVSTPTGLSLVPPELSSISAVRASSQKSAESR
jgi:hypothetical protein